jgi:predicted KAP-like P-loop ATPase
MWNDIETIDDLLNFKVTADVVAQLIRESSGQPVSIGVSGRWGTGKSSLVKMIGASLKESASDSNYLYIEFNAWLYQGYDDARASLLQTVADHLLNEAEKCNTSVDKVKSFIKRINWFRVGKMAAPIVSGAIIGGSVGGPIGGVLGAVGGILKSGTVPSEGELNELKDAYDSVQPEFKGLLQDNEVKSLPKEIDALRKAFSEILEELNITLVVLVDDLDRCLPTTAISTLEAMRLLLFLPRTAFIIAADERMIRSAVRLHFRDDNLDDDLVTSYFDKLIQVPIRVPRLGVNEVKVYLMLLLADLAVRRELISQETHDSGKVIIIDALRKSWEGGIPKDVLTKAYGEGSSKIILFIDMADQLALLMTNAKEIAGNPRLIKRFMNNLMIREAVANIQEMRLPFEALVKMQLFERCASLAAFDYLTKAVSESDDGKPDFIQEIEKCIASGGDYEPPDTSWDISFIQEWIKINPPLAGIDLRPLLHLSRDRSISLASYDELSKQAQELFNALEVCIRFEKSMIKPIQELGENEAEKLLSRLINKARNCQYDRVSLIRALHIPKAYPTLGNIYASMLSQIPPKKREAALLPLIKNDAWAKEELSNWVEDERTPISVKKILTKRSD